MKSLYNNVTPGCGSTLTDNSGELNSPNYPYNYFNNWDCRTLIRVSAGRRIRVSFTDFDTEFFDYLTVSCSDFQKFDKISIRLTTRVQNCKKSLCVKYERPRSWMTFSSVDLRGIVNWFNSVAENQRDGCTSRRLFIFQWNLDPIHYQLGHQQIQGVAFHLHRRLI